IIVIGNESYNQTTAGGDYVFAGEGTSIYVTGNISYRSDTTEYYAYRATESTQVTFGPNQTNADVHYAYGTQDITSRCVFDTVQIINSNNTDISSAADIVLIDTSSGAVTA